MDINSYCQSNYNIQRSNMDPCTQQQQKTISDDCKDFRGSLQSSGTFPITPFNYLKYLTYATNISGFLKGDAAKGAVRLQSYKTRRLKLPLQERSHQNSQHHLKWLLKDLNLPHTDLWDAVKPNLVLDKNYGIITQDMDSIYNYKFNLEIKINTTSIESVCC